MIQKTIYPGKIKGTLFAPSSKSTMQRALVAALLSEGVSEIEFHSLCNDVLSVLAVIEDLGAEITRIDNKFIIKGGINPQKLTINCGESGLCSRIFSSVAASTGQKISITGKGSLLKRNLTIPVEEFQALGIHIETTDGHLPLTVCGTLKGGIIEIDGSHTSQVLSGLLMALPLAAEDSEIHVKNLNSKPYIDLTIDMLSEFGIWVMNQNYEIFKITGNQKYRPAKYISEGDWSGAAFFLVAAALAGEVTIRNLSVFSKQADRAIIEALKRAGAAVSISEDGIHVQKNQLKAFAFDASNCPDLFPPLVALASGCEGITTLTGVDRLPLKESNRAKTLLSEFSKIGIKIQIEGNLMNIEGSSPQSATVDSHNDHRIAMALAVAALGGQGAIKIENAQCVEKSYAEFWDDLGKLKFC